MSPHLSPAPMLGESSAFFDLLEHTSKLAQTDFPVIIWGERGSGKELIAHRLHYLSQRWEQPFIKVNCATMNDSLLDAELFGHEAGAFTDAKRRRIGKLERADGGTLFLDELAAASTALQEKLLRVVEYGELERLGGEETRQVDVRFIAASHENLWELAERGMFRQDLLDRLCFDMIRIPPLRERREDIIPLAEAVAVKVAQELGRECFPGFHPLAKEQLLAYSWPGNVRQLHNVVGRSIFHHDGFNELEEIRFLPQECEERRPAKRLDKQTETAEPTSHKEDFHLLHEMRSAIMTHGLSKAMENLEALVVADAMTRFSGKQTAVAHHLGLSYHQLRGLIRKYRLNEKRGGKHVARPKSATKAAEIHN
ncbi:MAG: sigma 54-interacting transcriptional regulator [Oligoflexus sp.]